MSPWHLMPLMLGLLCVGAWASYSRFNQSPWYIATMCSLGLVGSLVWALMCRAVGTDSRLLYSVSMVADLLTIAVYTLCPLVLFGVRLSPAAWAGLLLVLIGTLMIKWGG